jgi:CheY-like chemotaxis protein
MGKKILLADDSITIQKVIELTFSDEDFDVVTVGNGRLALEKVQEVRPDIVLCDIIMPEKDGYEVCEFIKKSPALQHIPVLLLTGAFEPFDQERAARVGSDGYLAKPFEPETLIAKVKDLLSRAAASSSRPSTGPAIPFVALGREPEPPRASPPSAPPLLSVVPPRPPEPIPFPRAASPEPFRAGPPPVEAPLSVSFVPEEPFEDLDPSSFGPDRESRGPGRASEPIPFRSAADELLPMTAEESESLGVNDTASTVMFNAGTVQWQTPPAPTPFEATPVLEAEPPGEPTVFEEVIEEYVEFGGAYTPMVESAPQAGPEPPPPPPTYVPPARPVEPAPLRPAVGVERAAETVELRPTAPGAPAAVNPPSGSRPPGSRPPASTPRAAAPNAPAPVASTPAPQVREAEPEPAVRAAPAPAPNPPVAPSAYAPPFVTHVAPHVPEPAAPPPDSFADLVPDAPAAAPSAKPPSEAAEVKVPVEMVETIAQRVVAQISEKVVREIAWDVIPDLAEQLIKAEIERLKAELQRI